MNIEEYNNFTLKLQQNLETDKRVIGLIALGSMAKVDYLPDEWSDHDFFVIVESGMQEEFRQNLKWLPLSENIIFHFKETEHGVKVIYNNGHLLEFAIFDVFELELAKINRYNVLFERKNISRQLMEIQKKTKNSLKSNNTNDTYLYGQFITNILVGLNRYNRGEKISAHKFIKFYALHNLIILLTKYADSNETYLLDNIDNLRRFEEVYPEIGEKINHMLILEIPECAKRMIELADKTLSLCLLNYPKNVKDIVYNSIKFTGHS